MGSQVRDLFHCLHKTEQSGQASHPWPGWPWGVSVESSVVDGSLWPFNQEVPNKAGMHLQKYSVITTQSQQVSSHRDCKRKSPPNKITDFHSWWGSATKMTLILTQTWKRMWSSVHMPAVKSGIPEVAACLHYVVISVCVCMHCAVCLFAFACLCQQYLSHSFHTSDSSGCLCLQILRWSKRNAGFMTNGLCFFFDGKQQNTFAQLQPRS